MLIYVPIETYGLRLCIVVLQELQCLLYCLHVSIIRITGIYHFTKFRLSTSSSYSVLPEGVYCCFTRTTLFSTMFTIVF